MKKIFKKKKKLYYLDITKGFGILLVVCGHIFEGSSFSKWIYSFHIPLFFIISGFLLKYNDYKEESFKEFAKKRIMSLAIPYIFFSLINIILKYIFLEVKINEFIYDLLRVIVGQSIFAMWFLPALFISEILFFILNKYLKKRYVFIIICILMSLGFLIHYIKYNIIMLVFAREFIALGFICLGYYTFESINNIKLSYLSILIIIIINIIISQINTSIDLWSLCFGNIAFYILSSVLGSMATIFFFKKLDKNKVLYYWGKNSLIIMSTHQILLELISKNLNYQIESWLAGIILLIIIMLLEYPIIQITNNKMKFILGKSNKIN